jgi:hypothetical protein
LLCWLQLFPIELHVNASVGELEFTDVETLNRKYRKVYLNRSMSGNGYVFQLHAIAIYALGLVRKRTVVTDTVVGRARKISAVVVTGSLLAPTATFSEHLTVQWNV